MQRFLRRGFRNGRQLLDSFLNRQPCERAVLPSGATLRHPAGQIGLPETLVEVWHRQVYTGRFYQPAPGDLVIDAGANVGLFSIHVAQRQPQARVIAFEPARENFEALHDNLQALHIDSVQPVRACLSDKDGHALMHQPGGRSLDYRARRCEADHSGDKVPTLSWQSVMRLAQNQPIAMFKLDIEGSERSFLANAGQDDVQRIQRFVIEYHDVIEPGCLDQIRATLGATHDLSIEPCGDGGYGMVYATRKAA
ncbi:MAG: FkbM family methyltransferase [Phycisphaeraceae bacterium]|nr:FkbM family methyltransferase [Phycisphaeraceae bacterium]